MRISEKVVVTICFFFVLVAAGLHVVSANFVCGEVNGTGEASAGWFVVNIFYTENSSKTTSCQVSPENNRYCCDPLDIKGVTWKVGKNVSAYILDSEEGYFALPVNVTISGGGYDVFPILQLTKAIRVLSPNKSLYAGTSSVNVRVDLGYPFSSLRYVLNDSGDFREVNVCSGCSGSNFVLGNLSEGKHELLLYAGGWGGGEIMDRVPFSTVSYIHLDRIFNCKGCKGGFVPSGALVNVSIVLNASSSVDGVLSDSFPNDWEHIGGGTAIPYSESHDAVSWNVNGKNIAQTYTLRAPDSFFPQQYEFQSSFEDYSDSTDSVYLFFLIKMSVFSFVKKHSSVFGKVIAKQGYSHIRSGQPLVIGIKKDADLSEIIAYPTVSSKSSFITIVNDSAKHMDGAYRHFSAISGMFPPPALDIFIYPVNGSEKHLYEYVSSGKWSEIHLDKIFKDGKFAYYEGHSNSTSFALKRA